MTCNSRTPYSEEGYYSRKEEEESITGINKSVPRAGFHFRLEMLTWSDARSWIHRGCVCLLPSDLMFITSVSWRARWAFHKPRPTSTARVNIAAYIFGNGQYLLTVWLHSRSSNRHPQLTFAPASPNPTGFNRSLAANRTRESRASLKCGMCSPGLSCPDARRTCW